MLALTIDDKKLFTKSLFVDNLFDHFLCCKVSINKDVSYTIDGHYNMQFFDTDEQEYKKQQTYAAWTSLKPIVFQMIKGERLPLSFQIVLCVSKQSLVHILKSCESPLTIDQIEGLYVNINYKDDVLTLTTGSALTIFTPDRSLEMSFEDSVIKLIRKAGILFTN